MMSRPGPSRASASRHPPAASKHDGRAQIGEQIEFLAQPQEADLRALS